MAGFENDVVYAKNADFTQVDNQSAVESNGLATNGQLWIGTTSVNAGGTHINVGSITSPLATITIGYSSPNITLDIEGGSFAVEHLTGDTGGQLNPVANNFNILASVIAPGTSPILVNGSGNTLTINIQRSQAVASADITKVGLSNFNSSQFSVASTGFVSLINGGFTWTDVTSATQTLAVQNGYLTDRGAGVVYTLPATAAIGDEIRIVGKLGITTITPNANQQILLSSASGTVGATGTVVGTNVGDCIDLICITSGASCVFRACNFVGNWTVN